MSTVSRILAGLLLAGGVVVQTAPIAAAARGTFVYYDADGGAGMVDPRDGVCYPLGHTLRRIENNTDRSAALYTSTNCRGPVLTVMAPYSSVDAPGQASVLLQRKKPRCLSLTRPLGTLLTPRTSSTCQR
ncbi:hypothetical protein [Actinokineospora sp. NBRC 105648]|uniref:hypothetical protein n=1 Tax=Actinokineospora sp. NBRC 105648 TaxID=3032206 RepID=UPI0024A58869|nr:hypothetical protein [Actinokineospora sp. NBRC 105648]GLZ42216.1 hypothetical protein Acsp05_58400 [Actinokineospora sp. NBRC 105648]